jgi:hypothetical protein
MLFSVNELQIFPNRHGWVETLEIPLIRLLSLATPSLCFDYARVPTGQSLLVAKAFAKKGIPDAGGKTCHLHQQNFFTNDD